jgi:hypothetical protein
MPTPNPVRTSPWRCMARSIQAPDYLRHAAICGSNRRFQGERNGSGEAVSRILSSPSVDGGEGHLSRRPIPGIGLLSQLRNGPFLDSLFGLAPGEVFRAPTLARRAVGSYPAFSPLPQIAYDPRRFVFCGTVCRPALVDGSPACIPGGAGVTRPRALESSDFPPAAVLRATFRPPGTAHTLDRKSLQRR